MTRGTQRGLAVLAIALSAGIGGDVLLTRLPERLSMAAWLGWLACLALVAGQRGWLRLPPTRWPLWLAGTAFLPALLWRESDGLFALNLGAIFALAVWSSPRLHLRDLRLAGALDLVLAAGRGGLGAAAGPLPALNAVQWSDLAPRRGRMRLAGSVVLGLVLTLPILLLFGALLGHADPLFGRLLLSLVSVDLTEVAPHVVRTGALGWAAGGLLVALFAYQARPMRWPDGAKVRLALPVVATAVVLVGGLLAAFLVVQARYLFGGAEVVERLSGLGYAEYARRGFFELLVVAGVTLPLLVAADGMLDRRRPGAVRRFHWLGAALLGLLSILLLSAVGRLRLYVAVYGLTELRVFAAAALGWLLVTFGWLGATLLRGHRRRFVPGALAAGLGLAVGLNLLNPAGLVARVNLERVRPGDTPDVAYLATLGPDAVPALLERVGRLAQPERCALVQALEARQGAAADGWTLARRQAERAWGQRGALAAIGCPAAEVTPPGGDAVP